jgi:hypothetical protein
MTNTDQPTREEIAIAFLSFMDGVQDHEIKDETGLIQKEVDRIIQIRKQLQAEMPDWANRDF